MDEQVAGQFEETMLRMRRMGGLLHARLDLTMGELVAMKRLSGNRAGSEDNVFAQDLVGQLASSKASVSQMLAGLERRGYVERAFNPSNRRQVIVTVTEQGESAIREAHALFSKAVKDVMDEFGEEDTRELIRLVQKLSAIVTGRVQKEII